MPIEIRNPAFNHAGTIDCEIDHPKFGWIPFTADPGDAEPIGADVHARALLMGPAPYVPPPAPTKWIVPLHVAWARMAPATAEVMQAALGAQKMEELRATGITSDNIQVRNWLTAQSEDPDIILAME